MDKVCYEIPPNVQAPPPPSKERHQLHGADDLLTLFDLKSLWERSVKPYTLPLRSKQKDQPSHVKEESKQEGEGSSIAQEVVKPLVMEKTYAEYVKDLPGQVRPSKRGVSKYQSALAIADSSGGPIPTIPRELTGLTSMREIVFRPETTMQRIAPFDDESLRSAFTVEAGPVDDIDMSLLESDDVDKHTPKKKKKKKRELLGEEAISNKKRKPNAGPIR